LQKTEDRKGKERKAKKEGDSRENAKSHSQT
jgi:hypothetical protein